MSILAATALKPLFLLTLRGGAWPIATFGRLLSEAGQWRAHAVTVTYLTAMGHSVSEMPRQPDPTDPRHW